MLQPLANRCSKVALKTFVDNVAVRVIEAFLIGDIWNIFAPSDIMKMSDELVTSIAAESPESRALRQQLQRKLDTLRKGLEICQRYSSHRARHITEEKVISEASKQTQAEDETEAESSDSSCPVIVRKLKFTIVNREANFVSLTSHSGIVLLQMTWQCNLVLSQWKDRSMKS